MNIDQKIKTLTTWLKEANLSGERREAFVNALRTLRSQKMRRYRYRYRYNPGATRDVKEIRNRRLARQYDRAMEIVG